MHFIYDRNTIRQRPVIFEKTDLSHTFRTPFAKNFRRAFAHLSRERCAKAVRKAKKSRCPISVHFVKQGLWKGKIVYFLIIKARELHPSIFWRFFQFSRFGRSKNFRTPFAYFENTFRITFRMTFRMVPFARQISKIKSKVQHFSCRSCFSPS